MKKFLIHIGIILVITYIAFFGLDTIITHNLQHSDALMFSRWNQVVYDTTQYDVLINGNSRAWTFYDPFIIDSICGVKSYNLGLDGRWLPSQIARYKFYRQYHNPPKVIVQSVEQFTLSAENNKFEREQFTPYLYMGSLYEDIHTDEGYTFVDRYIPFVRYIGYRNVIFEGLGLHNDLNRCGQYYYQGFRVNNGEWRTNTGFTIDSISFDSDLCIEQKLERYIAELRADNVKIVFVMGPIYRGAKDTIIVGVEEQRMYDWYVEFGKKYRCDVLNYLQSEFSCDTAFFFDPMHVNARGAQLISIQLAHDLDSLNLF